MFGAHQMQAITFTEKPLKFNIIFHEGHAIVNTSQNPNVVPGAILQSIGGVVTGAGSYSALARAPAVVVLLLCHSQLTPSFASGGPW